MARQSDKEEQKEWDFHPLAYFPHDLNIQGCVRLKSDFLHGWQGTKCLGHHLLPSGCISRMPVWKQSRQDLNWHSYMGCWCHSCQLYLLLQNAGPSCLFIYCMYHLCIYEGYSKSPCKIHTMKHLCMNLTFCNKINLPFNSIFHKLCEVLSSGVKLVYPAPKDHFVPSQRIPVLDTLGRGFLQGGKSCPYPHWRREAGKSLFGEQLLSARH